jgi:sugar/nucleoside kinase (ribokinase family)
VRIPLSVLPPASRPFDVVGFGQNSVDLIAVVADYPKRNSKQRLTAFTRKPGGQIATAAMACARLGWRSRYIGAFGGDDLGAIARGSLRDAGVDVDASWIVAEATNQFAIVIVDGPSGDRTVLWDRSGTLAANPALLPRAALTSGRVLLLDCHEPAAAHAASLGRHAGMVTVLDVETCTPDLGVLLDQADAIIAAEEFPSAFTGYLDQGRALRALAEGSGAPLVCVTLGAEGSLTRCGGREFRTSAFSVDCVDSTGAGDAFRAGFAAACLLTPEPQVEEVLRYANAVAALNCRAIGAQDALPTTAEVDALLRRG